MIVCFSWREMASLQLVIKRNASFFAKGRSTLDKSTLIEKEVLLWAYLKR